MSRAKLTRADIQAALETIRRRGGLGRRLPPAAPVQGPGAVMRPGHATVAAFLARLETLS